MAGIRGTPVSQAQLDDICQRLNLFTVETEEGLEAIYEDDEEEDESAGDGGGDGDGEAGGGDRTVAPGGGKDRTRGQTQVWTAVAAHVPLHCS